MATFTNLIAPSSAYKLTIVATQKSQNAANNTSVINVTGSIVSVNSVYTAWRTSSSNSITINGTKYAPSAAYDTRSGKSAQIFSYDQVITHNSDGTKTVPISWTFNGLQSAYNPNGSISANFVLAPNNRQSSFSLSKASVEYTDAFDVLINSASSDFRHDVTVTNAHGDVLTYTNVVSSVKVTVPGSWIARIPNATYSSATVRVVTKSGSTTIGAAPNAGITLVVPAGTWQIPSNQYTFGDIVPVTLNRAHTTMSQVVRLVTTNNSKSMTASGSTTSINFDIPLAWASDAGTASYLDCALEMRTMNGTAQVGVTAYVQIRLLVPSNIGPSVSISRTAFNSGLTGYGKSIQGISRMTFARTVSAAAGTVITKTEWLGDDVPQSGMESITITAAKRATQRIRCRVTDSRGRTATSSDYVLENTPYEAPTCAVGIARCNAEGVVVPSGTYVTWTPTYKITSLDGVNKMLMTTTIDCDPPYNISTDTWASGAPSGPVGGGNILTNKKYNLKTVLTDSLGKSVTVTREIPVSDVLINFGADGKSIGIGTYARNYDLDILDIGMALTSFEKSVNIFGGLNAMGDCSFGLKTLGLLTSRVPATVRAEAGGVRFSFINMKFGDHGEEPSRSYLIYVSFNPTPNVDPYFGGGCLVLLNISTGSYDGKRCYYASTTLLGGKYGGANPGYMTDIIVQPSWQLTGTPIVYAHQSQPGSFSLDVLVRTTPMAGVSDVPNNINYEVYKVQGRY